MASEAWVTLATNDSYAVGVLVLAQSLRAVGTTRPLVVMVSNEVSPTMREKLGEVSARVHEVNVLDSEDSAHLALLERPELGVTFTKLHCWTLTDYSKCVFLDADTLVIQNSDELFDREEFSAAPDAGWPDCFNSGVFVFQPSLETYSKLIEFAVSNGSFDGGDQGLLNSYFSDWATKDVGRRLPFIYNMTASAAYSYRPAFKEYGKNVRIVHFIGYPKPWHSSGGSSSQTSADTEHLSMWWDIFNNRVQPRLSSDMFVSPPSSSVYQSTDHYSPSLSSSFHVEQEARADFNPLHHLEDLTKRPDYHYNPAPSAPPPMTWTPTHDPQPFTQAPTTVTRHIPSFNPPQSNPHSASPPFHSPVAQSLTESVRDRIADEIASDQHQDHKGVAAQLAQLIIDADIAAAAVPVDPVDEEERAKLEEAQRRKAWERGEIDYMGNDSFDNIMEKILKTMNGVNTSPN